jgi:hypothetical protein
VERDLDALKMTASMDQAIEALRTLAEMAWVYFNELRVQGFATKEAFALTLAWQQTLTAQSKQPPANG